MKKKLIVLILVVQIVFFGLFVTSCTKSVISYDGIYVDKFSDETINQLINDVNSTIQGVVDGVNTVDEITDIDSFINSYREKLNENDFTQESSLTLESLIKYAKEIKNAYYVSKIVPEVIKTDKIVIPSTWKDGNKIVSIGPNVLRNNNKITDIVIQEGIMQIMDEAFKGCSSLVNIVIPESVSVIGNDAFNGCSGLTSITIPDSVTVIGSGAFWGCSGLTSITIPDSVTGIGEGAFWGCSGLTSITIPNSVTIIGEGAFYECSGLTSITIPNSVTVIGEYTFYKCSGLTSITIPDSVTEIGDNAFEGCSGLIKMNYTGTMSQWHNVKNKRYMFFNWPRLVIHCTDGDITGWDKIIQ